MAILSPKMVNTRSKMGALKKSLRSEKASTYIQGPSSTSGKIARAEPPADEPKQKRRRIAEGECNLPSDKPPRRPDDGTLEALPMDIILEILSYLHPLDLLHLARMSQIFRNLLISKRSCHIWRAARAALGIDVPECPPDQSEPQWASLIFDLTCPICNATDVTEVEWGLRVRGCTACLEGNLLFRSEVPKAFPRVRNLKYILDLLPFAYQQPGYWRKQGRRRQKPPLSTKLADREYYRPAIQPMIDLYRSLRKRISAKTPGAKAQFDAFVAERKQNVVAILDAEEPLKSWGDAQAEIRDQKIQREIRRWQALYRNELIVLGYHQQDADRASMEESNMTRLEGGWEKNRAFFEDAASRMKVRRIVWERSPKFYDLCRSFLAKTNKKAPVQGLWPSSKDLLEGVPQIEEILGSGDEGSYQDELKNIFPTALDRWWESRKDILVEKIFDVKRQQSPVDDPEDGWSGPNQDTSSDEDPIPSFASAYAGMSGPTRQAILELAKSVFTCPCQATTSWLRDCPIYCDRGLTNHLCHSMGSYYHPTHTVDFSRIEFDVSASSQVDAVCTALGLEASEARFTELDELDARFRCVNCPYRMKIMNWRAAIRHRHNKGKASRRFTPTFAKISDEEAVIVKAFELDHPDRSSPLGRIRSPLREKAFYTPGELLDYLKDRHKQNHLTPDSYWIDPSVPPKPVLETAVFKK